MSKNEQMVGISRRTLVKSTAIGSLALAATVGLHLYVTFDNDDQLARHFDYARLDWAFVKWRGSRWHDLS